VDVRNEVGNEVRNMEISGVSSNMTNMIVAEMAKKNEQILHIFGDLATGRRIDKPSDDPVGIAVSSRLESEVREIAMAERNAQMGISMVQTADIYLESVANDIQRISELSVQAANGTLNDSDRQAIQAEVDQLSENIDTVLTNASFNSKNLFDGSAGSVQVGGASAGREIQIPEISSETLGLENIDVTSQAAAESSIAMGGDALDRIMDIRTELGASQNALEATLESLSKSRLETLGSLSLIQDANIAGEIINATQAMVSLKSQAMLLSQTKNLTGGLVSSLLKTG